jgi:hypothetical protein
VNSQSVELEPWFNVVVKVPKWSIHQFLSFHSIYRLDSPEGQLGLLACQLWTSFFGASALSTFPTTFPPNNSNADPGVKFIYYQHRLLELAHLSSRPGPHWDPLLIRQQSPDIIGTSLQSSLDLDSGRVSNLRPRTRSDRLVGLGL